MGDSDGSLIYMENIGATVPVFVQRTGSANPFNAIDVGVSSAPALGDLDGDGTLRRCPSIDKLRPHVFCRSQATWTSSWAMSMASSSTSSRPPACCRVRHLPYPPRALADARTSFDALMAQIDDDDSDAGAS